MELYLHMDRYVGVFIIINNYDEYLYRLVLAKRLQ